MIIQYTNAYLLFEEDEVRAVRPPAISPSGSTGLPRPVPARPKARLYLDEWYARFRQREIQEERMRQLANKLKAKEVETLFNAMVVQGMEQRRKAALWTTVLAEL